MKADLSVWIPASLYKHFRTALTPIAPTYIEGEPRATNKVKSYFELRFDGPYFRARDAFTWEARIEFNILVSTVPTTNLYSINTMCGHAAAAFKRHIAVLKTGVAGADQSEVGCLRAVEGNREWLKISHFGIIETAVKMMQSTVEAAYQMEFEYHEN